ncbi:MAG: universal stress protein [Betaproteobacteria bacterium]
MHAHLASGATAERVSNDTLKLLLPIVATPRSLWGLAYAIRRRDAGQHVSALLLFVGEPVVDLHVLRFKTQEDMRRLRTLHGNSVLDDAAETLANAGISAAASYREGDIAFQILDVAEQVQCHEIVLPAPHPRWARLLSRDVVRDVLRQQRGIPVTTVGPGGVPGQFA